MSELELLERKLKRQFVEAFSTYKLLADDDRILVGLSGGKDSLCLLEFLAKRSQIHHPRFSVEAIHVRMANISYESSTEYLEQFCLEFGVRLHTVTTSFDTGEIDNNKSDASNLRRQKQPCFLCSWNRRKQMFNLAQQLGCNKIALGHHQDDLLLTTLMNLTFQGRFDTMPAKLVMRKMPLEIIRPLCLMHESDIRRYAELRGYRKQTKICPYDHDSHRADIRKVFDELQALNPDARSSIWNALNKEEKI